MTYNIWHNDQWYHVRNRDNTKKVVDFKSYEDALEQALVSNLIGAKIYKLEATAKFAIDKL